MYFRNGVYLSNINKDSILQKKIYLYKQSNKFNTNQKKIKAELTQILETWGSYLIMDNARKTLHPETLQKAHLYKVKGNQKQLIFVFKNNRFSFHV
jgi:hypothetical protein